MKKYSCIVICFMLMVCLCACGGTKEETPTVDSEVSESVADDVQQTPEISTDMDGDADASTDSQILTGTCKVPLQQIYVDIPSFNFIEEGYTNIYFDSGKKYVTFTCMFDDSCEDVASAHDKTVEKFMQNVDSHHHINGMGTLNDATVTVNGIETYNYEGYCSAGRNPVYDAYIYGYSFVYNGFPCSIVGVVMDEAQPETEKQQVKEIVDEMMKSVRNSN